MTFVDYGTCKEAMQLIAEWMQRNPDQELLGCGNADNGGPEIHLTMINFRCINLESRIINQVPIEIKRVGCIAHGIYFIKKSKMNDKHNTILKSKKFHIPQVLQQILGTDKLISRSITL